jgi:D-3-phosphoglycerate dehydrogenase
MRAGNWHQGLAGGTILEAARLGVIGLGKLGSRVAQYGRAFGMDVVAWSRNLTPEKAAKAGAQYASKGELLATSDFITIHVPLSDDSRGMIGAAELATIKPGAVLVNTSRGPIVDQTAMIEALKNGQLAHAALDVYDREPLPSNHELRTLQNVTLSPHLGYLSEDIFRVFYGDSLESIEAWLDGKPIRILNPEALGSS